MKLETKHISDRPKVSERTSQYLEKFTDVPIYADTYRLVRYMIFITQNTPSNLKHISEKIQIDSLDFVLLLYKTFSVSDRTEKIEKVKEAISRLDLLIFQLKLLYDLKITSSAQNVELTSFIGVLYDTIEDWIVKLKEEKKIKK